MDNTVRAYPAVRIVRKSNDEHRKGIPMNQAHRQDRKAALIQLVITSYYVLGISTGNDKSNNAGQVHRQKNEISQLD